MFQGNYPPELAVVRTSSEIINYTAFIDINIHVIKPKDSTEVF